MLAFLLFILQETYIKSYTYWECDNNRPKSKCLIKVKLVSIREGFNLVLNKVK